MDERQRTTKRVAGTFIFTFHGDYVPAEDINQYVQQWLNSGLDDRDDLRDWSLTILSIREEQGDPEGFDS